EARMKKMWIGIAALMSLTPLASLAGSLSLDEIKHDANLDVQKYRGRIGRYVEETDGHVIDLGWKCQESHQLNPEDLHTAQEESREFGQIGISTTSGDRWYQTV